MSEILVHPDQLYAVSNQLRMHATNIQKAILEIDHCFQVLNSLNFEGISSEILKSQYLAKRNSLLRVHLVVLHFADALSTAADAFEKADRQLKGDLQPVAGLKMPDYIIWNGVKIDFDTWRNERSWKIVQTAGQEPVIITGTGQRINLIDLQNGKKDAIDAYSKFMGDQSEVFGVMSEIAKGNWVSVSGYVTQGGKVVEDYWRSLPGGNALGGILEDVSLGLGVANIGYSLYQAATDKSGNEWVTLPLGKIDGKDIVYTYYQPKVDYIREAVVKGGGVLGGVEGGEIGIAIGIETGPGAVVTAIGGAVVGSKVGEETTGSAYDLLVHHDINVPPRPASQESSIVSNNSVSSIENNNANQIDVGQLIQGQNGSATMEFTVDSNGQNHLESYIVTPNF